MTDRPTNPTDRPALRPAAPACASVDGTRPTDPTDRPTKAALPRPQSTDQTAPTNKTRRSPRRLVGAVWSRLTYRPTPTDRPTPTAPHAEPTRPAPAPTVKTRPAPPRPTPTPTPAPTAGKPTDSAASSPTGRAARVGMRILLIATAVLLAVVVTAPISLSAQDLVGWAESPTGLGLDHFWAVVVFIALDAAAGVCVLLSVYCAWRGEPAGGFGIAVWVFALTSAFANYQHGHRPDAPGDAWWFFPAMSLLGPALLEMVTRKVREWVQRNTNRRGKRMPRFGWRRWIPGVGSWRDTYGAYRTANLMGIETVDLAIAWYHWLCPDGSLRVAAAMRERGVHADRLPTAAGDDSPTVEPTDRTEPTELPTVDPTPKPTVTVVSRPTAPAQPTRPVVPVEPTAPRPDPTDRPTGADRPAFTAAAIRNARILRSRYGSTDSLRLGTVRSDLGWSFDRADPALKAYLANADRPTDQEDATDARPFAAADA